VLAVSLGVAGCGGDPSKDPDTLQVWVTHQDAERKVFTEICQDFEKWYRETRGKTVRVQNYQVPFDGLLPKLRTVCAAGRAPDICRVDVAHVVPMAFGGAIVPLDTLPNSPFKTAEEARQVYVPAAVDSDLFALPGEKTHLWGIPDQTNTVVLFYNKSHFRDAADRLRAAGCDPERPPATWEELARYAAALTDPAKNRFGYAMELKLWWDFPVLNSWGAPFLATGADGALRCALNDPRAIEALEFVVKLYQEPIEVGGVKTRREAGAWVPGAVSKDQGFINGQYSMVLNGPWILERFHASGVEFGTAPIPSGPGGSISNVGGQNMVVFKNCPNKELALDFLIYVTSTGNQARWGTALGQIPVRPDAFDKVDLTGREALRTFFEQMLRAKARPPVARYDRLEEIFNLEFEEAMKGNRTVKESVGRAVERINREVLSLQMGR
jgi:ABC-type glycerol-3-phosphate transport system substrate-binding protein